ncbi:hypothetical protein QTN25_010489 [Entamoeba marina]
MKINPWKNSTTPLQDIKNIRKVFPRIQTLRINKSTIKQHYEQINILCFDNIEIVKDTPLQRFKLPPLIRNKAHIAFKEKDINNTVYTVYLDYCLIATIGKIRRYPNIRHLFLILSSPPILDEVNELNKCSNSIHITIKLSNSDLELFVHRENLSKKIHVVTNIFNSLYVIPQEESIDFCLNTLRSIDNMILFEKFFLPTKLIRKNDGNVLTDLTYFEYVKEIKLIPTGNAPKNYIKLPTSTEDIKVDEFNKEIDHTEIINWKDLNNIQRIQDFHQLYVPYPQIKKKVIDFPVTLKSEKVGAFLSSCCIIYFLMSIIYRTTNIIYSNYNGDVVYESIFKHFFYYYHIYLIFLEYAYFTDPKFHFNKSYSHWIYPILLLWYPYSLLFYKSTIWLYLFSFLTIPLTGQLILTIFMCLKRTHFDLNVLLTKYLHGYWINIKTETKLVKILFPIYETISICGLLLFLFCIPIGLIISLINMQGILRYVNIISLIAFIMYFKSIVSH